MKKTVTINLTGQLFQIDEDACNLLEEYLTHWRKVLINTEGYREIYNDIESRIAELLLQKIKSLREMVILADINDIIAIMGKPKNESENTDNKNFENPTKSKLYRNSDDRILGGVCSGMAAFWQQDPTLIRIVFIFLSIFGMAGVLLYIILWIILPEAVTPKQKHEMQGNQLSFATIRTFITNEFQNVKKFFQKNKRYSA